MFLRLSALLPHFKKHLAADKSQQYEGQPVVDSLDFIREGAGDGVADERHNPLKKPETAGHLEDGGCPYVADHHAAGDTYSKGVHGEACREQEQRDYVHENDASFRMGVEGMLYRRNIIILQGCALVNAREWVGAAVWGRVRRPPDRP